MTDLNPWAAQAATISDDQAQQMRLVIAGHAENTADAKLLMQAFGLLPDPLCDRWEITASRKHRVKESAKRESKVKHRKAVTPVPPKPPLTTFKGDLPSGGMPERQRRTHPSRLPPICPRHPGSWVAGIPIGSNQQGGNHEPSNRDGADRETA